LVNRIKNGSLLVVFDGVLLSLAQQHEGGVPELMNTFFSFLRRKTDFFVGGQAGAAKEMVLKAFSSNEAKAFDDQKRKKKEEEERKQKMLEKEKEKKKQEESRVEEITDEEEQKIKEEQKKQTQSETQSEKPKAGEKKEKQEGDEEDDGKLPPNSGNGSETDRYSWTQTLSEVEVKIPIPPGTKSKQIDCEIKAKKLRLGVKGKPLIINNEEFEKAVKYGDATWMIQDSSAVIMTLPKQNGMEWWGRLLVGEPEISTKKIQPENSKLDDLDSETRATVEKMMHDTRQKQMGLPTSEEQSKQDMLKKFMAQHPEMDFSKAKMQ